MVDRCIHQNLAEVRLVKEVTMSDELDNIEEFESKENSRKLPIGWLILFWGLIIWGVFYLYMYSPSLGGWSQGGAYEESVKK